MKRLFKVYIPVLMLFVIAACSGPNKEAELAKLKEQHDALALQIATLEKELGDSKPVVVKVKTVAYQEVAVTSFNHYIEVQGRLDGEDNVDVFAEAMGVVDQVYVKAGDNVSKGQKLAQINDKAVREQLNALESSYQLVSQTFEKQQRLWDQKIGSEIQYLQAKTQKESMEAQIASVKQQLNMYVIKSPISGSVEMVSLKVGQAASPQMPVFKVVNFSTNKVVATISEAYADKVNDGDSVRVFFPDINYEVTGKLTFVSRYINPVNRTFEVEIRIGSIGNNTKANMIAVLRVNDYHNANAISLAINSVNNDKNGSYVWIAKTEGSNLVAKRLPVVTGLTYNGAIEIKEGLKAGDKVITSGFMNLKEGDLVKN